MASPNDRAGVQRSMRSASRLSPLQRAYLMGFRRARILARRDVNASAYWFEVANDEVHAEPRGVRREMARLRAIDHAPEAERDGASQLSESAPGSQPASSSTDITSAAFIAPYFLISRLTEKLRLGANGRREERNSRECRKPSFTISASRQRITGRKSTSRSGGSDWSPAAREASSGRLSTVRIRCLVDSLAPRGAGQDQSGRS